MYIDAIEKLGYDQDKIDLYRKSMLSGRRQGKLRFYISKEDYEGLQETLAIYAVPGLVESILEASKEPLSECVSHEEAWK